MILIFNTIIETEARDRFSNTIADRITFGRPYRVITVQEVLPELNQFSHLILSGSELSASQGSEWDERIISVIRSFLLQGKPILGICHGHQILARAIAGDSVCRRAPEPEFGWKKIEMLENPLFKGIEAAVFLESRYDEVFDLPAEFTTIAWNDKAEVQAFQYNDQPVWGVQFHPEMLLQDGTEMVEKHLEQNPQDRKFYSNELQHPEKVTENLKIFENFLSETG